MYSYAYIPKTLEEQRFIVCNNPEIFSTYFIKEATKMKDLMTYYYETSSQPRSIIKSYDYQRCTTLQYYIDNNVYNLSHTDTSYRQLKKIYPALKIPTIKIKY